MNIKIKVGVPLLMDRASCSPSNSKIKRLYLLIYIISNLLQFRVAFIQNSLYRWRMLKAFADLRAKIFVHYTVTGTMLPTQLDRSCGDSAMVIVDCCVQQTSRTVLTDD